MIIGWYLYYINRYRGDDIKLTDLGTVLGVIGGGAVLALFPAKTDLFAAYGIGLCVGFFAYFILLAALVRKSKHYDATWFIDGLPKDSDRKTAPRARPMG
ncbi:MAG: hypothetical protein HY075_12500 [Deltaproteobacteria bacterium]|nr:hypothetical protein [Deltaproteobacteria bacterium]